MAVNGWLEVVGLAADCSLSHLTLIPISPNFSDFLKVRKPEKDAVAKEFAIHSHISLWVLWQMYAKFIFN